MKSNLIKDMVIIAVLAAILFVQEEALTFLPNISLTVFLIVLYAKKLGFYKTSIIVTIHVLLDNLVMGSFNLTIMPFMFIGWMLIPIFICFVFKRVENNLLLGLLGILFSFAYSWIFIIPNVFILNLDPIAYLISDIPFELILALSSFLSIAILYIPCSKVLDKLLHKDLEEKN